MRQRGFTILEVVIALAILGTFSAALLGAAAGATRSAHRAKKLGIATDLARSKMYDLEEMLLKEGYQELDQEEDGDFDDEGWPSYTWEAKIEKIELPGLGAAQSAMGGEEGGEDREGGDPTGGLGGLMGGLMGGMGGMGGLGDMGGMGDMGAAMIASQYEMISNVLEQSIRKVTLTVRWKVGKEPEELVVVCYFTDRLGVDRAVQGLPLGGAGNPGGNGVRQPGPSGS